jgi:hypothetical protein
MSELRQQLRHPLRTSAAIVAAAGVALQYRLVMTAPASASRFSTLPLDRTVNFFSFFTILCNTSVATAWLLAYVAPGSAVGRFCGRPGVHAALTGYMLIVGAVYVLVLRQNLSPQQPDFYADAAMHYLAPVLGWLATGLTGTLGPRHVLTWMILPSLYACWTLVHGAWTGFYPYPFVNVARLGYPQTFINIAVFVAIFVAVGFTLVAIDRWTHGTKAGLPKS